jgi:hypothetical protein
MCTRIGAQGGLANGSRERAPDDKLSASAAAATDEMADQPKPAIFSIEAGYAFANPPDG